MSSKPPKIAELDLKWYRILRKAGLLDCPICHEPFKMGERLVRGTGHKHRQRWPRHERCLMLDSRPRAEVVLMEMAN